METSPCITVVVPVLNEEASLGELQERLAASLPENSEIIYVDDGSTDGTFEALRRLASGDPRVRVCRFSRNFGKSAALAAGFRRARAPVVATIDADLQEDPADIPRLVAKLDEGFDLVGGWRKQRNDARWKVLGSRLFNAAASLLSGARFRDINCGLKAMRRSVVEDIALAGGFHRFFSLLAWARGYRVAEVEIAHRPRRHGRSRYGGRRVLEGLLDLLVVLFLGRFEGRPSRYFAGLGVAFAIGGAAISAYLAALRLITGSIQARFPLLALGLVLLVVGMQLFSLGLFGDLIAYHFRSRSRFEPVAEDWKPPVGSSAQDLASNGPG